MKIRTMLMVSATIFAVVPMVVYSVFAGESVQKNGDEEFRKTILEMADNERYTLQTYIDTANKRADTILDYEPVKQALSSGSSNDYAADFISTLAESDVCIDAIRLVKVSDDSTGAGEVFCGSKGTINTVIDNFASYIDQSQYKPGSLYFNSIASSSATGGGTKPTMFMYKNVGDNTLLITYKMGSNTGYLYKASAGSTFYSTGSVAVADSSANHNYAKGDNFRINLYYDYPAENFQSVVDSLGDNGMSDIISYSNKNGEEWYAAVSKAGGENGLYAIASAEVKRSVGAFSSGAANTIIVVTVLLSLISLAGAIVVSVLTTKPLKVIEETLEKVRRGDHEARIPTAVSNNEYGQMSRAFNNLLDEIVVSEDRYRTITEMSDNIIFEWNFKTNEVFFTNNFNKKFSYRAPSDHFGDSFLLKAKLHEDDAERYKEDLEKLSHGEEFKHNEYRMKNIYGDYIWVLIRTATLRDKEGNPQKVVGVMLDIDRAKKSEQQLTARASFDALTELYNRETIESQIDNEINLSEARKSEMAVLFIDVDDFKHYNDQYSHATGDQVLKFVARTIKGVVSEFGFAGRYGGDEFIACVRNAEINDPTRVAQDIISRLDEGFECDGSHLTVSVSIGISVIKDDYNTRVEYIIGKADDAMYSVKKNGKSNYAYI